MGGYRRAVVYCRRANDLNRTHVGENHLTPLLFKNFKNICKVIKEFAMAKIITLTLSPAIDVEYHSERSHTGLNRTYSHTVSAGGKGINVTRSVIRLATSMGKAPEIVTVFPAAGETGSLLCGLLEKEGIDVSHAVRTGGSTRVNTSLIPDHGAETEINAPGTPLTLDELRRIEGIVLDSMESGDVVCICGSVPEGVSKSYPALLAKKVKRAGGIAVLDCDGEALLSAAREDECDAADVIKPNSAELCGLLASLIPEFASFAKDGIRSEAEFSAACNALPFGSVIMTMAGDGSMYSEVENGRRKVFTIRPTPRRVVRLKGAGDTFLGAYVYARYICGEGAKQAMETASDFSAAYVGGEN